MEPQNPRTVDEVRSELQSEMLKILLSVFQFLEKYRAAQEEFPGLQIEFVDQNTNNLNAD